jgi:hypothetical protein
MGAAARRAGGVGGLSRQSSSREQAFSAAWHLATFPGRWESCPGESHRHVAMLLGRSSGSPPSLQ